MSDRIPPLTAEKLLRILFKLGFKPKRRKGSHLILAKSNRLIVVPVHKGREIPRGTLGNILKQAGISKQEFLKLLKK